MVNLLAETSGFHAASNLSCNEETLMWNSQLIMATCLSGRSNAILRQIAPVTLASWWTVVSGDIWNQLSDEEWQINWRPFALGHTVSFSVGDRRRHKLYRAIRLLFGRHFFVVYSRQKHTHFTFGSLWEIRSSLWLRRSMEPQPMKYWTRCGRGGDCDWYQSGRTWKR